VRSLTVDNGMVNGAVISHDGRDTVISCSVVVSDIGPSATMALVGEDHLPDDYRTMVKERSRPCAMLAVNFASEDQLVSTPGMLSFGKTRRLCYVANFTELCPEMAPPGWNLYVGSSVPSPAVGDFDEAEETELLLADLRDEIVGFEHARILSVVVTRDDWPPQRAVAGFDLPHTTPIANLWNVGDAVKEYANGGTTACAETAKLVVEQITERYPVAAAV
jgi:phytoene desaturase